MRVVYASGYSGEAIVHRGMLDRQMVYLAKPCTTEKLLRLLRAVLDETAVTSPAGGPQRQA